MSITTALSTRRESLRDREDGFTLIELLVVVIIIGILAAIAIPIYIGVQNNAKDSAVKSDLTNLKTAVVAWTNDNAGATTAPAPSVLSSYGYSSTDSVNDFNTAPALSATSNTTANFCYQATSKAGNTFHISATSGAASGACS